MPSGISFRAYAIFGYAPTVSSCLVLSGQCPHDSPLSLHAAFDAGALFIAGADINSTDGH
jgi:hypothetical protein